MERSHATSHESHGSSIREERLASQRPINNKKPAAAVPWCLLGAEHAMLGVQEAPA
jgi:hypothetical protein